MKKIPLMSMLSRHGQAKTAKEIGVTQGAISKALRSGRAIFLFSDGKRVKAEEVRAFPSTRL
ncbi:Cro/CI family transcriptional regulator [Neisseria gonorrhoeae]|uniref:Cro/CI family transcriptional regulator n=1 Tax=Neisseria gonorrhoeae TaxID=485 RepID=UPI0012F6D60E|nr:Cro/CI family transcriptional regulator [Neisseria gonorrhoeae]KAE9495278.1 regulatory protein cro [Neisseria gonorrhoeae]